MQYAQIKKALEGQLERSTLSHAYLFIGPKDTGKRTLALELATKILGTSQLDFHTDFHFFDAGAAQFGVDQAREVISRLSLKPFRGPRTIAVIDNAHLFSVQTSNALLKTLEEPAPQALIILIASGENILPTLRSRCHVYSFSFLGRPEALPEQVAEIVEKLDRVEQSTLAERLVAVKDLSELDSEQLKHALLGWLYRKRALLESEPQNYIVMRRIMESLAGLRASLNKKLLLQHLLGI